MPVYSVYILASRSRCLYVGVTNDLERRVAQHKLGTHDSFTRRYRITRLVYAEHTENVSSAIEREKQLKRWPRLRKIRLIEQENPSWLDKMAYLDG
jgi:putative endonuclease